MTLPGHVRPHRKTRAVVGATNRGRVSLDATLSSFTTTTYHPFDTTMSRHHHSPSPQRAATSTPGLGPAGRGSCGGLFSGTPLGSSIAGSVAADRSILSHIRSGGDAATPTPTSFFRTEGPLSTLPTLQYTAGRMPLTVELPDVPAVATFDRGHSTTASAIPNEAVAAAVAGSGAAGVSLSEFRRARCAPPPLPAARALLAAVAGRATPGLAGAIAVAADGSEIGAAASLPAQRFLPCDAPCNRALDPRLRSALDGSAAFLLPPRAATRAGSRAAIDDGGANGDAARAAAATPGPFGGGSGGGGGSGALLFKTSGVSRGAQSPAFERAKAAAEAGGHEAVAAAAAVRAVNRVFRGTSGLERAGNGEPTAAIPHTHGAPPCLRVELTDRHPTHRISQFPSNASAFVTEERRFAADDRGLGSSRVPQQERLRVLVAKGRRAELLAEREARVCSVARAHDARLELQAECNVKHKIAVREAFVRALTENPERYRVPPNEQYRVDG